MARPGTPPVIGVIGGSGVYDIDGFADTRWEKITSSFGEPSDELLFGELDGQPMVFLPRHGRGHRLAPGGIMIHRIDLRDHGMFAGHHPLTLLTLTDGMHRRMTRGAGRPNRVLINNYRDWLERSGLSGELTVSRLAGVSEEFDPAPWATLDKSAKSSALTCVRAIRPRLASRFKAMADEDLAVAGLILVARTNTT